MASREYPAFTNFTIKVNVEGSWPKTMIKVLKSVEGVTNFKMDKDGKINISGYIDPTTLLKCLRKAGKNAQIVHWQYGECSSNLYGKTETPAKNNGNGNGNGYYLYPGYGYPYSGYTMKNYAYNHLECSGDASDCSGHHIQKPNTPEKSPSSSKSLFHKLSSSVDSPQCCCLM